MSGTDVLDRIFAVTGLLGLIAFMGIVTFYVMEPDLWLVVLVGLVIAIYFVWQDVLAGGARKDGRGG